MRMVFTILLIGIYSEVGYSDALPAKESNDIDPVAVLTSNPGGSTFYNLADIIFSSGNSYDDDGYITQSKFYINGQYVYGSSYTSGYTECFALYDSPAGDCFDMPSGATTVSVKLEVKDNDGNWDDATEVYTIQEHKGRKYFIKDHLGSVRTTVNRDGNVLGFDDYYPFGLAMDGGHNENTANPSDNYKFTGHELDDEANLNLYHMVTRGYDPVLGRFNSIDAHYFYYPHLSSYSYVGNNPISYWDPFGMDFYRSEDGAVLWADTDEEEYFKDGVTYTNIGTTFLSFDGEFLTVHNQVEDKGGNRSVETSMFEAKSGLPNEEGKFDYSLSRQKEENRGPVPEGLWQLTGQRYHTTDPDVLPSSGYYDTRGRGWYMKLKPVTAPTYGRTGFEIHPDGNVPGTAGCIGISCQVPNLPQQFYDAMEKTLQGIAKDKLPMINIKYKKSED